MKGEHMKDTGKEEETVHEYPVIDRYRIRVLKHKRTEGIRVDIREYVVSDNFEGFTRRGISLANVGSLNRLRDILADAAVRGWPEADAGIWITNLESVQQELPLKTKGGGMYILIKVEGGIINHVESFVEDEEAISVADEMAKKLDPAADDVRIFHLPLDTNTAEEFYSAPVGGE
jgi:hypothetical protein